MSDYESMKVAELRLKCKELGLPSSGKKAVLVERLSASGGSSKKKAKKAEEEDFEEEDAKATKKAKPEKKKAKAKAPGTPRRMRADRLVPMSNASVYSDGAVTYGVMLNQTNIANNNNKFYVIQLLATPDGFYHLWTRWGRVGEPGQNALKRNLSVDGAKKAFAAKFKDKTKNVWSGSVRDTFVAHTGKYTLLDMEDDDDDEEAKNVPVKHVNKESTLPPEIQSFVRRIYQEATGNLKKNIDCQFTSKGIKTPLGVLSMAQVERGDAVLDRIQAVLSGNAKESLQELSSEYYTKIPHAHGRSKPPVISTMDMYQSKVELSQLMKDMLQVSEGEGHASILVEDDVDAKYEAMGCTIELVEKKSEEFNNLMHHIGQHRHHQDHANMDHKHGDQFDPSAPCKAISNDVQKRVANVYRVSREEEEARFDESIGNEHMLFHASRFANWVGILTRGVLLPDAVTKLGIRRTDFGWLGAGIYFGSEWSTSENYCGQGRDGTGCMLVLKVALGKVWDTTKIDGSIREPPKGFNSIHGNPDKPSSGFADHEYAVYSNKQSMMRYLIEFKRQGGGYI